MTATKDDIRNWLRMAPEDATHMLVMCDTYDYVDYPVYIKAGDDPRARSKNLASMERFMECYALHLDFELQLNEHRAYHFEQKP